MLPVSLYLLRNLYTVELFMLNSVVITNGFLPALNTPMIRFFVSLIISDFLLGMITKMCLAEFIYMIAERNKREMKVRL